MLRKSKRYISQKIAPTRLSQERLAEMADVIDRATDWEVIRVNARYGALVADEDTSSNNPTYKMFSLEELADYDPRLAQLFATFGPQRGYHINANIIRSSLALWHADHLEIPREAMYAPGAAERTPIVTSELTGFDVKTLDDETQYVTLQHFEFCMGKTEAGLDYARVESLCSTDLCITWLDAEWPQWRERYQLAQSLGLDGATTANYVFDHNQQADLTISLPDLDDISFAG